MIKTILIIVLSVTIFGIAFFLYVKKALKKQLNFYLSKNTKKAKNIKFNQIILQNFLNSSFGISKIHLDIS